YCHCDCSKHSGHRSLLTCFESDHGAYCDICMGEAILAARLAAEGRTLDAIRSAIDRQFGS
ncbi:MAG: PCYCGC motif-containing (lipo)protein, partial [Gemmatimonadales bacterium]